MSVDAGHVEAWDRMFVGEQLYIIKSSMSTPQFSKIGSLSIEYISHTRLFYDHHHHQSSWPSSVLP